MSIVDLTGKSIESEKSVEEKREAALKEFQNMLAKLDEERIPLIEQREDILDDIRERIQLIRQVVSMTYPQPITKKMGNSVVIDRILDMPVLEERQIALLGLRLFDLIKKV